MNSIACVSFSSVDTISLEETSHLLYCIRICLLSNVGLQWTRFSSGVSASSSRLSSFRVLAIISHLVVSKTEVISSRPGLWTALRLQHLIRWRTDLEESTLIHVQLFSRESFKHSDSQTINISTLIVVWNTLCFTLETSGVLYLRVLCGQLSLSRRSFKNFCSSWNRWW